MIENPMIRPQDEPQVIGHCQNRRCREEIYEKEGYEFDGFLYCSHNCIGEELEEEGRVVKLGK